MIKWPEPAAKWPTIKSSTSDAEKMIATVSSDSILTAFNHTPAELSQLRSANKAESILSKFKTETDLDNYKKQPVSVRLSEILNHYASQNDKDKKYKSIAQIKRENEDTGFTAYRASERSQITVYAGGNNTPQAEIVSGVTARFRRILEDAI